MLRRKFFAFTSAVAACAAFFCLPAAAADFTCPYFSLPLTGDWAQQRMQPGSVPPNTFATLFASRKAGEGVLITPVFSSTIFAKNPRKPDGTSHRVFLTRLKFYKVIE